MLDGSDWDEISDDDDNDEDFQLAATCLDPVNDPSISSDEDDENDQNDISKHSTTTATVQQPSQTKPLVESNPQQNPDVSAPTKAKNEKIQWRKKDFIPPDIAWQHIVTNDDILPKTPIVYFMNYFTEELFQKFAEETNTYALMKNGVELCTSSKEMKHFFGVSIIMGNLQFPRIRMYWRTHTRIALVADNINVNRYFKVRTNLHVNSQQEAAVGETCRFWKVKPVIEAVRKRCKELPLEEYSSIDEQMIPFTGRMPAKQFIKNKPNPVGLKNFVMCGKSGRAHDFELYQGKGTGISVNHKHLGLGGSIVMRLSTILPHHKNFKLFFDNYFTSMGLIRELKGNGILALGVVKSNRMDGCVLKTEKELRKDGRGANDCRVSREGDISVVRWLDNGVVNLSSSFVGVGDQDHVRRWSASEKKHMEVARPEAVKMYNDYMGGVDKLDFLISLYRIDAKTKKWPVRVIFHFIDFALVNSWLEYRDTHRSCGTSKNDILDLLGFRECVAETLIKANLTVKHSSVGRPRRNVLDENEPPRKKPSLPAVRPVYDVRYDKYEHFPEHIDGLGQLCKLEGCSGRSRIKCTKCKVFLCLNKNKNCFLTFHDK